MPLTVRKFSAQVRDETTGDMIPAGLLSSDALGAINTAKTDAIAAVEGQQAVSEAAIELKGATTLASIPNDYTALQGEVTDLKSDINANADGIKSIVLDESNLILNVDYFEEPYTPSTQTYRIVEVATIIASPNTAYNFEWQSILSTWQENPEIRFTLLHDNTTITNYLVSASAKHYQVLANANTNKIKIEAVISKSTRPTKNGIYRIYNLIGYIDRLNLSGMIDAQTDEDVATKIQSVLTTAIGNIIYQNEFIKNPYTTATGTYKNVTISQLTLKPSTIYSWIRLGTSGAVADRDLNFAIYTAGGTKITDFGFMTNQNCGTFTTNESTAYGVLTQILSLGTAPAANGFVESRNIIITEGKVSFSDIIDVVDETELKTAVEWLNADGELRTRKFENAIISTTYHQLYAVAPSGISETFAFDVNNITENVTIRIKNNNAIALAYSDIALDSLAIGSELTPLYDYKIIDDEITVPAHLLTGQKSLIVTPSYRATNYALCKCVPGITEMYKKRPPIITFIDDDGFDEAFDNWETLGNSLGIKNGFAIITGSVGQGVYGDWDKIRRLANEGFVFVSHTHGHADITQMTDEQINADAKSSRDAFITNGLTPKFIAYPGGYIDKNHYGIIESNFDAGIAGGASALNKPPLNRVNIVRSSIVSGTKQITVDGVTYTVNAPKTIEAIKTEFDHLIMNRGWLVFTTHFRNSYTDGYYYNSDFSSLVEDIVKYACQNGVAIKTVFDGYDMFKNRVAIGHPDDSEYYIVDCDGNLHEQT